MASDFDRASAMLAQGRFREAAIAFDAIIQREPYNTGAWANLGAALLNLGQFDAAIDACDRALQLGPDQSNALNTRGAALNALGRAEQALANFDTVIAAQPMRASAHVNRGASLLQLGRIEEAVASLDRALALEPRNADTHYYRGLALYPLNRQDDTLASFDAALKIRPGEPDYLYSKGVARLAFGQWRKGWPLFEQRWRARRVRTSASRAFGQHKWDGRALNGPLRIWPEQGIGEQILFARLLPIILERVPRILLECEPRLTPLFARAFPQLEAVAPCGERPLLGAAAQASLGGLGAALNVRVEDVVTRNDPLWRADPALQSATRARYEALARGRPIVGISWFSQNPEFGRHKSADLMHWAPLLKRDLFLVNLQYSSDPAEIAAAERAFGCTIHTDPAIDQMKDLDAFAAQLAALDSIVSVSNTTVHLAGALGVPCFVVLPPWRGLIWYWGVEGETTPWYRSVRLVRRAPGAPWSEQIARAAALAAPSAQ